MIEHRGRGAARAWSMRLRSVLACVMPTARNFWSSFSWLLGVSLLSMDLKSFCFFSSSGSSVRSLPTCGVYGHCIRMPCPCAALPASGPGCHWVTESCCKSCCNCVQLASSLSEPAAQHANLGVSRSWVHELMTPRSGSCAGHGISTTTFRASSHFITVACLVQAGPAASRTAGHRIAARPLVGIDGARRRAGGPAAAAPARTCRQQSGNVSFKLGRTAGRC